MTVHEVESAIDQELRQSLVESELSSEEQQAADSQLELFIKFKTSGAPKSAIIAAMGLSEDTYEKFNSRAEVKQAVLTSESNRLNTAKVMDEGWDVIENTAMGVVLDAVRYSQDPDYALRAAAVANKAIRRRREDAKIAYQNQATQDYHAVNNIAVLSLPKVVINRLVSQTQEDVNAQLALQAEAVEVQKYTDVADVTTTNRLLSDIAASTNPVSVSGTKALPTKDDSSSFPSATAIDEFMKGMLDGKFNK